MPLPEERRIHDSSSFRRLLHAQGHDDDTRRSHRGKQQVAIAFVLENYPHYTCTKSSLFLSLRAVLSQMYIGMKHALLAGTRALHYDTLS